LYAEDDDDDDAIDFLQGDGIDEVPAVPFECVAIVEDSRDGPNGNGLYKHPLVSGVLVRSNTFDSKQTTVAVVRVPGCGDGSFVSDPVSLGSSAIEFTVTRPNGNDFAEQLLPNGAAQLLEGARRNIDTEIQEKFGSHVDYGVLNAVFQVLAPPAETWKVRVTFHSPWMVGDFSKVLQYRTKRDADSWVIIPLRTENLDAVPKAQVRHLDE